MLLQQGGAFLACHCSIFGYEVLDGIEAHWPPRALGNSILELSFLVP
jgi:hypothetical protein